MSQRAPFLKALDENEDDTATRLIYADWLDDQGEHEEADRQRKWPAAKGWLVRFCKDHNPSSEEGDPDTWVISYKELIALGREAIADTKADEFGFSCGNNMAMSWALQDNCREFWKNWSIVTGIPVPPGAEENSYFGCAC